MVKKRSKKNKREDGLKPYSKFLALSVAVFNEYMKPKGNRQTLDIADSEMAEFANKREIYGHNPINDSESMRNHYGQLIDEVSKAKFYEVDKDLNKHLLLTKAPDVSESLFEFPFERIFFSTSFRIHPKSGKKSPLINGIYIKKKSCYAMVKRGRRKKNQIHSVSDKNMEKCMCGKYKHEHLGTVIPEYGSRILGDHGGPAEGCERFTWNPKYGVAISTDVFEIVYMIETKKDQYINDDYEWFGMPEELKGFEDIRDNGGFHKNQNKLERKISKILKNYLINLNLFLTTKERVYVERDRSKVRAKSKKKLYYPNSTVITCDNTLKQYFKRYEEALDSGGKAIAKHDRVAFWREYKHKKYHKNMPIITRPDGKVGRFQWIRPTVVGGGLYMPKHRRVKQS
tara:strand:+ start:1397 stop:2593 length:1197 start_codon:yes stop_codon:yes gene_type:complete